MRRVLLIGMLVAGCALVGGCWLFITSPVRDCPIESLLLDEAPFPPGAVAEEPLLPLARAAMESAGRDIGVGESLVGHDVYRYLSAARAAKEFRRARELEFSAEMDERMARCLGEALPTIPFGTATPAAGRS